MTNPNPVCGYFVGLTTLDMIYTLDEFPTPNLKYKARSVLVEPGGPTCNAAVTFRALGGQATFATVIGDHALRPVLLEDASKHQVEIIDLDERRNSYPPLAGIFSTPGGDRTILTQARGESEGTLTLPDPIWEIAPDIVLVDGFYMDAALRVAQKAREEGITVIMDGGSWKPRTHELLPYVDILIASANFHLPSRFGESLQTYSQQQGIRSLAITHGPEPIELFEDESRLEIPVPSIEAVDTLGAGDVFHGAFCWYYLQTRDISQSLSKASEIAAASCLHTGARGWMD